jgi:hypothetical protein
MMETVIASVSEAIHSHETKLDCFVAIAPRNDEEEPPGVFRCGFLRQIAFAAQPDALFGFHLRHFEQTDQHAELVTPRDPSQLGGGLRDEGCGLIRPAILRIIGSRTPPGCGRSPAACLGQKITSNRCLLKIYAL